MRKYDLRARRQANRQTGKQASRQAGRKEGHSLHLDTSKTLHAGHSQGGEDKHTGVEGECMHAW